MNICLKTHNETQKKMALKKHLYLYKLNYVAKNCTWAFVIKTYTTASTLVSQCDYLFDLYTNLTPIITKESKSIQIIFHKICMCIKHTSGLYTGIALIFCNSLTEMLSRLNFLQSYIPIVMRSILVNSFYNSSIFLHIYYWLNYS